MLTLEERRNLVLHATGNGRRFYRTLYAVPEYAPTLSIAEEAQWRALPFVTKDALIAMPLRERSFLPLSALDHLRTSSGTSGKPPLFSPRTHVRAMEYRLQYHDFANAFLAFTVPMMPHWHERFQKEHGRLPRVIAYDPKNPTASVRLAAAAGVDAFSVFVYHVNDVGEAMKKISMHTRIRFAEVTGETCTRAQYEYLRETFPNAVIVQSYNSSEVEDAHIGMPCKPMDGSDPLAVYHPKDTHYLELIDPDTGTLIEPKVGAEGDLLITSYPGEPASFPLIRYRIGDTVRVVEERCPHGSWSFTVVGRTDMDFLKVPGGVLKADEIARTLRLFPELVSDRFELHCTEEATVHGPLLKPTLCVEPRGSLPLEEFARTISKNLRVAPNFTYEDGVRAGRYLPLSCALLSLAGTAKTRRITLH